MLPDLEADTRGDEILDSRLGKLKAMEPSFVFKCF